MACPVSVRRCLPVYLILLSLFPATVCRDVLNLTTLLDRQLTQMKKTSTAMPQSDLHGKAGRNNIPGGFCKTWIGTVVTENSTWEEQHCRQCRCDAQLGVVCKDPPCSIAFRSYLQTNCEEWSADGCCCLRSTCVHNGVHYAANDWFLLNPSDPCTVCKCDPSDGLPQCLEKPCPKVKCVDAATVPGQCCPACLAGHNCGLPPLPVPEAGGLNDVTPILQNSARLVSSTADPRLAWNCTCIEAGGDADCVPQ